MTYDISIKRLDLMALFDLKGHAENVAQWCGEALPIFPTSPLSLTRKGTNELMWLAPNHWILRAPLISEAELLACLRPGEAPGDISVVRVSDTMEFFSLHGPDVEEAMSVVTPLDTHPSEFPVGSVTYSEAFGIKALILRNPGSMEFGVERSFGPMIADYLQRTLQ